MRAPVLILCALAPALSSCFAITNLDRFKDQAATPHGSATDDDLVFSLKDADAHVGHFFELRVIDASNTMRSRLMVDVMNSPTFTIDAPRAIPKTGGPFRLDFWSDKSGMSTYNGLGPTDMQAHAWRIDPVADFPDGTPHVDGLFNVSFEHNTNFTDIDQYPMGTMNRPRLPGGDAKIHLKNLTPYLGHLVQITVADKGTGHIAGIYRYPSLAMPNVDPVIPGTIDVDIDYDVDVYADANGDGMFQDPAQGGDHGFRTSATSNGGVEVTIDAATADHTVSVGNP